MGYRDDFREVQREFYWSGPRIFFAAIFALILLAAVGFGLRYLGYLNTAFFAPRNEAIRRDVMIESRAYSEATVREMYNFQRQYLAATTDEQRNAIKASARHAASGYGVNRLPADLQVFVRQLNQE
jgi:hypothetical protein